MRPRLLRLAYRLLWNAHDAEEIAQEALATAWRRVSQLNDPGKRNTWLYRVVINLSRNRLRRQGPRFVPMETSAEPDPYPASGRLEHDELMERVRCALVDLPARQRAALTLRDMEQLEYTQIAAILGTRESVARILVHRARAGVRRILLQRWPESFGDFDR